MGQKGQTGTSMIIEKRPFNRTKKECRNCLLYIYDKRYCSHFKIPISTPLTGEVCKQFTSKYKDENRPSKKTKNNTQNKRMIKNGTQNKSSK